MREPIRLVPPPEPRRAVVDASVFVDALVPGPRSAAARAVLAETEPIVPATIDVEVLFAIARIERAGGVTAREGQSAIDAWAAADLERVDARTLVNGAWRTRAAVRPADGLYLELARGLRLPFVTCDARLARAPVDGVTIMLVT